MARKISTDERDAARETLREMFPVGATVRVRIEHVSRSGMTRDIVVMGPDGENVSRLVVTATGQSLSPYRDAVRMGGCGMDMGFALVYGLARSLYGDGRFTCNGVQHGPDRCPANDHVNERGDAADWTPGRVHSDAGYALNHRQVS